MFEDFDRKNTDEGRGRRGASALVSLGIFAALALAVGGAITAHQVHRQRVDREQQVTFSDLPAVRAPKPRMQPKMAAAKRAPAKRQRVVDLKEIPVERPDEAEGDLATTEDVGAVDGVVDGQGQGKGAAPPVVSAPVVAAPKSEPVTPAGEQERESIEAPRFISGCRAPEVPNALLSKAATIRIDVEMIIDAGGIVTSARVLQSHQLIPDDLILTCARAQVFEPAHLPDGTPVSYPYRRRFVFKPAQA